MLQQQWIQFVNNNAIFVVNNEVTTNLKAKNNQNGN
jgi:hypothetical protein